MMQFPEAHAATTAGSPQSSGMGSLIFMFAFFMVLYWMIWRPQSKRAKEHRQLMQGLAKNDEVLTSGGILGRVLRMTDDFIVLSVNESSELTIQKSAVAAVLPKGTLKSIG